MAKQKQSPYTRLFKHIIKGQHENDCWTWRGGKNNIGYPMIRGMERNRMLLAHRVMGEHMGLKGPEIHHTCNSYECMNPLHLVSGTKQERMDKVHANPDRDYKVASNYYTECPGCKQQAWYPTLSRYHKECFTCEKV